jgi:DNA mismatch repair protein MutS2
MRAEEAQRDLERFLDDALLAGLPSVRIVHGKGEGILRQLTRDYLKKHPNVGKFEDADPSAGGAGVTVATLK